jgi:FkbM family methyltransferase
LKAEFPDDSNVYGAKQLIKGSMGTVVDIGANLGAFTIYTALLHPQMQILSFEPTPPTFFFFICNLFLNKVELLSSSFPRSAGVLPLQGAVGATAGTVDISWDPSKTQNAAAGTDEPSVLAQGWQKTTVTRYPIISFLERSQVVRILKIDCEGCEFSVIPGLAEMLSNRTKIEKLVGEYHLSLLNRKEETFARKPSRLSAERTLKILLDRGCRQVWQINC